MSDLKEHSRAARTTEEMLEGAKKQAQLFAAWTEVNQHYLARTQMEWQASMALCWSINTTMLAADRVRLYQEWLREFSERRIEDATYAMDAARKIGVAEMSLSMGLVRKDDMQAARAT